MNILLRLDEHLQQKIYNYIHINNFKNCINELHKLRLLLYHDLCIKTVSEKKRLRYKKSILSMLYFLNHKKYWTLPHYTEINRKNTKSKYYKSCINYEYIYYADIDCFQSIKNMISEYKKDKIFSKTNIYK